MPTPRMAACSAAIALATLCASTVAVQATVRHRHRKAGAVPRPAKKSSEMPIAGGVAAAVANAPKGEVRAMWIVRDSLTSPAKIRNVVALAKRNHFNTLFVQVRGRGDAFYHSNYEPRSEDLAGQPDSFDPLQTAIDEGHKAGLEVHAWLNTFFVWHRGRRPYDSSHVVNQHPEWLVQDRNGKTTMTEKKDIEGAFLDPALPAVQEYTKNVFLDVVNHYDVDGIHFDYCRFPNCDYSFSRADMAAFRTWLLPQVSAGNAAYADSRLSKNRLAWYYLFPEPWREWRRQQVMTTVKSIADEAHRVKPNLIVSAAVFPGYRTAYEDKGQAWHAWLQAGILDAACPMTYNVATETVGAQVRDAIANSGGKPIVPGVGAWQLPAHSAIAKAQVYRQLGAAGVNFFSYDGMTHDGRTEAYLNQVAGSLFTTPAPVPIWHHPATTPAAITAPPVATPTPATPEPAATTPADNPPNTHVEPSAAGR